MPTVKTFNGIASANVKTIDGKGIALVKTFNGVTVSSGMQLELVTGDLFVVTTTGANLATEQSS